jgi:DNA repair exonuclease SbcCD ATPase subunit
MLSDICEVVMIVGNHDVNIFNVGSMDCLQPIVTDLYTVHPVHLLKDNEIYDMYCNGDRVNISFGLTNIWTDKVTGFTRDTSNTNITYIALYHGTIHGATLDNETSTSAIGNNSMFNCGDFKAYDLVMLGDIHKHQYLNIRKTIAYAGSLIQQNRGESLDNHGYIVWDITKGDSTFHSIKSTYGMMTVNVTNDITKDSIHKLFNLNIMPKSIDIKMVYHTMKSKKLFPKIYRYLTDNGIKIVRTIEENGVKMYGNSSLKDLIRMSIRNMDKDNISTSDSAKTDTPITSDNSSHDMSDTTNTTDTTNTNDINGMDNHYLQSNDSIIDVIMQHYNAKHDMSSKANSKQSKLVKKELKEIMDELDYHYDSSVRNIKLVSLEFDNMVIYLKGNEIDFTKFDKIVGLNAKNYRGKSCFIDVILHSIYGKSSRGKRKDMLNTYRKHMRSKIVLTINGIEYTIIRTSKLKSAKTGDVDENILFYKGKQNITGDTNVLTNKSIETIICSYNDMILESFVLQKNGLSFVDLSNKQRKDLLCKIAGLEVFDRIYNIAKSKHYSSSQSSGKLSRKLDELYEKYVEPITKGKKINTETKIESITKHVTSKRRTCSRKIKQNEKRLHMLDAQKLKAVQFNSDRELNAVIVKRYRELDNRYDELTRTITVCTQFSADNNINMEEYRTLCEEIENIENNNNDIRELLRTNSLQLNNKTIDVYGASDRTITDINCSIRSDTKSLESMKNIMITLQKREIDLLNIINSCNECMLEIELDDTVQNRYNQYIECKAEYDRVYNTYIMVKEQYDGINKQTSVLNPECSVCMSNILVKTQEEYGLRLDDLRIKMEDIQEKLDKFNDENIVSLYEEHCTNVTMLSDINTRLRANTYELKSVKLDKDKCTNKINELNDNIVSNTRDVDLLLNIIKLKERIVDIGDRRIRYENLTHMINEYKCNEDRLNDAYEEITKVYDEMNDMNVSIDILMDFSEKIDIDGIDKEIYSVRKSLAYDRETYTKIEYEYTRFKEIKKELKQSNNMKSVYDTIKKLLNTSGIVDGILTNSIIPHLEASLNGILTEVGQKPLSIEYKNSSINIRKMLGRNKIDVVMDSGYESYLLNLVFRLALVQINNHIRTDFIIIDEGFGACDDENKVIIKRVLEYMKRHFKWLLIVSHDKFIKSFYDIDLRIQTVQEKSEYVSVSGSRITNINSVKSNANGSIKKQVDNIKNEMMYDKR